MLDFFKKIMGGNAEEMKEMVANGAVIIDVRTPGEFAGGHAQNAVNIPLDSINSQISKIKKYKKDIVLCCASGMRSARAKGVLKSNGIDNVSDAGAWVNLR